ncbi:MAG: Hydrazine synthase subunit gamma [Anaerolineales bacterium]|nr:Hydrazine synthase subunit gamma [Anaerolineales bacterium]
MHNIPGVCLVRRARWDGTVRRLGITWFPHAFLAVLLAFLFLVPGQASLHVAQFAKRSSSAIAVTGDGGRLLVVNPDSNSVSVMDAATGEKLAELTVGDDPRTVALAGSDRAYVTNRGSNTVSVVDLTELTAVATIPVEQQPYGVVVTPDGAFAFAANSGSDSVSVIDTATFQVVAVIPVRDRPAGLAATASRLYVAHLLTGLVSVIDVTGLPETFPDCGPLDLDCSGEVNVVDIQQVSSRWRCRCGDDCYDPRCDIDDDCDIDIVSIMQVAAHWGPAYPVISTGSTSNLAQSIVLDPTESRAYLPHIKSNSFNPAPLFDTSIFPVVSVVDLATNQHLPAERISLETVDVPVNMPFDAAFTPDGSELWVLNAGSNDVSVIDTTSWTGLTHISAGANPRGIVLSPDGGAAYVNNTLDGTVSVIDTTALAVTDVFTATQMRMPPVLLEGKRLFHSAARPALARDQWMSCASCHFGGEMDGRTWNFPGLGPRNTPSLLGVIQTYPINWQADMDESQDQEHFIRGFQAGGGLISDGDPYPGRGMFNVGQSLELDALATFVDSIPMPRNPDIPPGGPIPPAVERGRLVFESPATGCTDCHPAPFYADKQKHDVGTADGPNELAGPEMDTPTLRGLARTAPYLHDGSASTLYDVLVTKNPADQHGATSHLSPDEIADLIAFMKALPYIGD